MTARIDNKVSQHDDDDDEDDEDFACEPDQTILHLRTKELATLKDISPIAITWLERSGLERKQYSITKAPGPALTKTFLLQFKASTKRTMKALRDAAWQGLKDDNNEWIPMNFKADGKDNVLFADRDKNPKQLKEGYDLRVLLKLIHEKLPENIEEKDVFINRYRSCICFRKPRDPIVFVSATDRHSSNISFAKRTCEDLGLDFESIRVAFRTSSAKKVGVAQFSTDIEWV